MRSSSSPPYTDEGLFVRFVGFVVATIILANYVSPNLVTYSSLPVLCIQVAVASAALLVLVKVLLFLAVYLVVNHHNTHCDARVELIASYRNQ